MKNISVFIYSCHRVIGLIAILPVVFLIVTGLALEFREELGLHEIYPESAAVLWLYGQDIHLEAQYAEGLDAEPATYERVITAFHLGKFRAFDKNYLLVASAISLLVLSLTGPFIWLKRLLFRRTEREADQALRTTDT